jgi:type I restriction enzyme M protein
MFCRLRDISNEASVEQFFVSRLLRDLGFKDSNILPKRSIDTLTVPLGGRRTVKYKPDYILTAKRLPRCVIDAKAPDEKLSDFEPQCRGYCLELNKKFAGRNPVEVFVLTNGVTTRLYKWDEDQPLLELAFNDFTLLSSNYERLRAVLNPKALAGPSISGTTQRGQNFLFSRPTPEYAKQLFAQCHRVIWKSEVCNPTAAFMEFTKLMFVKLWADKRLRDDPNTAPALLRNPAKLSKDDVTFSVQWVEKNEALTPNPVNDILFKKLRDDIEREIEFRQKKRIFAKGEKIDLRPDTIKSVVRRLEHFDMFGIDEDLNGRLFETFLNATMRGRELGQFFTPRSIVKLMTRMAGLTANPKHYTKVIDACCGTGGFLIEALTDMRNQVRDNASLSDAEKIAGINTVSTESLFGIDFGKNPPLARIARINMYLHADGGSRIYYIDALDKELEFTKGEEAEVLENQNELRSLLQDGLQFDTALTNPPFSMTKELSNETEKRILKSYALSYIDGTKRQRASLRSSAMFIERYHDLLRVGGTLFTVIDDTLLASEDFDFVRDFIRAGFIIRAIISLPGDAFKRSGARVKTSVLCLEKRAPNDTSQPKVFTAFAEHLGVDDLTPRAPAHEVAAARARAEAEIKSICKRYQNFLAGRRVEGTVSADRVSGRLDLKFAVPLQGRLVAGWKKQGLTVKRLGDLVTPAGELVAPKNFPDTTFTLVKVTYSGEVQPVKQLKGKHFTPDEMIRIREGDILFSKIRVTDGAIGIVPPELDGALVSTMFLVLSSPDYREAVYLWSVLRSHELRADLMSGSIGTGRYITEWESAQNVAVPLLKESERLRIADGFIASWELASEIRERREEALRTVAKLGVESEASIKRWRSYKAPQ